MNTEYFSTGEGEFIGGYGSNSYGTADDSAQRFKIITMLTITPAKTNWALAMGFIKATVLTNTYKLTDEGFKYWRGYDN